jgi:hypothetical protein
MQGAFRKKRMNEILAERSFRGKKAEEMGCEI